MNNDGDRHATVIIFDAGRSRWFGGVSIVALFVASSLSAAHAQTFHVTGSETNGAITGAGDVTVLGTTGPATTDILTLTGASNYTGTTTVGDGTPGHAATFTANGADFFSAASATTVTTSSILDLGGVGQTINTISLSGGTIQNGALTSADGIVSTGGTVSTIAGATGLTANSGTTTLTANNYTGATTISSGATVTASANLGYSAGSALTINTGGTANLGGFGQTINTISLSGGTIQNGALTSTGGIVSTGGTVSTIAGATGLTANSGTTTLTADTYTGATTVNGGKVIASAANAFSATSATTVSAGASLDLGGFNQTVSSLSGAGTVSNSGGTAAVLTNQGASSTFSGVIQDGVGKTGLTENSAGNILTLSGANTYTGATTITAGTIAGGAANAFSSGSALTINTGGTASLGGFGQTINAISLSGGTIQNGALTSTGGIVSTGGAVSTVSGTTGLTTNSGMTTLTANTYTGATTINSGAMVTATANGAYSAGSATTINTGGTANLGGVGVSQTINTLALSGGTIQNGTLTSSSGIVSTGGAVSTIAGTTGLTANSGMTTLTANTYTGATTINSGATVTATANGAYSSGSALTINAGGTAKLGTAAQTINAISLSGGTIQNGTLTSSGGIVSTGGMVSTIAGTTGLTTNSGTTTLNANTYTGGTTINGGSMVTATGNGAYSAGSALTINTGGTANLGGVGVAQTINTVGVSGGTIQNGTLTSSGGIVSTGGMVSAIAGTTGLTANSGTTTLNANTYTGATTINGGSMVTATASGAYSAGSALTINTGGTANLGGVGVAQTINTIGVSGGTIQNGMLTSSGGIVSTGGAVSTIAGTTGLTSNSGMTTLTADTYTGKTMIMGGTVMASAKDAFSSGSKLTIDTGGTANLGGVGVAQQINTISLSGGAIKTGKLASLGGIVSTGGAVSTVAGTTGLMAYAGTTTVNKDSYSGVTFINNGGTVLAKGDNAYSAGSALTIATGGTAALGKANQTINTISLAGGMIQNGTLASSSGIFSTGGTVDNIGGTTGLTAYSGTTTLDPDSYTGATVVDEGATLNVGANAYSATSALTIRSGGTASLASNTISANVNNDGALYLNQGESATNTVKITGTYAGQTGSVVGIDINTTIGLPPGQQRGDALDISKGVATGSINLAVIHDLGGFSVSSAPIPVLYLGSGTPTVTLVNVGNQAPELYSHTLVPVPNTNDKVWELYTQLNGPALAGVAGGVSSAVGAAATGFFQGFTAFIASPPNQTPNFVNMGVWTRDAEGMNNERATTTVSNFGVAFPTTVTTSSHFSGEQVGSDAAIYNLANSGWDLHGGLTGGEYQAGSTTGDDSTYFHVPFLGLYGAVTGHGFNANVLVRHDFWEGSVNSPLAQLNGTTMNGSGDAETAEVGYRLDLDGGWVMRPFMGFSYDRATFNSLAVPLTSSKTNNTLSVGPVTSELGNLGLQTSYVTRAGDWALVPNLNLMLWREFAGDVPGEFVSSGGGATVASVYSFETTRVGTFEQVGLGLAGSPLSLPNLLLNVRADFRSGDNIKGGTLTFGARYSF